MVEPLGHGRYRLTTDDGQSRVAYAVPDGRRVWVFIDGRTFVVTDRDVPRTSRGADPNELSAPMPATVTAINVAVGAAVEPGDVLIVLEAMKMELPIVASRAGRVSAVHCRVGEIVQPGVPLAAIEAGAGTGAQHG